MYYYIHTTCICNWIHCYSLYVERKTTHDIFSTKRQTQKTVLFAIARISDYHRGLRQTDLGQTDRRTETFSVKHNAAATHKTITIVARIMGIEIRTIHFQHKKQ